MYTSIIISAPPTALWASSSPAAASSTNGPVIDGRPRPGPAVGALPGCHPAGGGLPGGGGAARGAQRHGRARRAARPRRRAAEHAAEFKAFVHRGLEATLGARGRAPPAPRATRSRARRLVDRAARAARALHVTAPPAVGCPLAPWGAARAPPARGGDHSFGFPFYLAGARCWWARFRKYAHRPLAGLGWLRPQGRVGPGRAEADRYGQVGGWPTGQAAG